MSSEEKKMIKSLQNELVELLLGKAKVSKKSLYDSAISSFVNDNIDLLTPNELKKYQPILLL